MIDQRLMEDLAKLDEAAGRMAAAQAEIVEICAQIAGRGRAVVVSGLPGPSPAVDTPLPAAQNPPVHKRKYISKGTRARSIRGGVPGDPVAGAEKRPWIRVICSECNIRMGSRRSEGVNYPIVHKQPEGDKPCDGSFEPGLPIESGLYTGLYAPDALEHFSDGFRPLRPAADGFPYRQIQPTDVAPEVAAQELEVVSAATRPVIGRHGCSPIHDRKGDKQCHDVKRER
jgi:hypothetical protein